MPTLVMFARKDWDTLIEQSRSIYSNRAVTVFKEAVYQATWCRAAIARRLPSFFSLKLAWPSHSLPPLMWIIVL